MSKFKEYIDEGKLAFPIVVVVNGKPVAVAKDQKEYRKVKGKYPQSSKDEVEFVTLTHWKKAYGYDKNNAQKVDSMLGEGWGASGQKRQQELSKRNWEGVLAKYAGDKNIVKKLEDMRRRNFKASAAARKLGLDWNEIIV